MENYPSGEDGIHSISVALAAIESSANNNECINISDLQKSDLDQKWA